MKENIKKILKFQRKAIKKYGFYVHHVTGYQTYINSHTHGLEQNFNHLNFQIVLPMETHTAHNILTSLVGIVKNNNKITTDTTHIQFNGVNMPVHFIKIIETDEVMLRVIFPDTNFYYSDNPECDPLYAGQENFKTETE